MALNLARVEARGEEGLGVSLGRGFAGALLFSLPMLMTMEMWALGATMAPERLAVLLLVTFVLLVRLSRFGGLRHTVRIGDDLADALVAVAVATAAAGLVLWLFGEIRTDSSPREIIGKVALQIVPGGIGAVLARNQLGSRSARDDRRTAERSYGGELLLMTAGALFLSLNVAPTEEVMLIAYQMSVPQALGLTAVSVALMHAFVYSLGFRGTEPGGSEESFFRLLARFTVVGYALVFGVNVYLLWTFGRLEGLAAEEAVSAAVVLGFPGGIGAAAARLLL